MLFSKRMVTVMAVTSLVLASGTVSSANKVKLVWWDPYGPPFSLVAQKIIDDFNKSQNNIQVTRKMVAGEGSTLIEKLALAVLARNGPDMAHTPSSSDASELWARGLTLPMDSYMTRDRKFWSTVYQASMQTLQYKGRQLGLPDCTQAAMLYWNKDHFAQAGLDPDMAPKFEDLKLYASKLTKRGVDGKLQVVGFHPANIWGGLENWVSLFGGSLYDAKNGRLTINTPTALNALEWVSSMSRDMQGTLGLTAAGDWNGQQFITGKVSMMMGHHYVMKWITAGKKKLNFNIGLPPAPGGLGAGKGPIAGLDCNFIVRSTKHPNEAYEFMKYFVARGGWLTDSPDPSCVKEINEKADPPIGVPAGRWKPVAVKVLEYTRPRLSIPGGYRILEDLNNRVGECLAGKKSSQQALTEAQTNAEKLYNEAIKRVRWAK